jgi:hypothetical protein
MYVLLRSQLESNDDIFFSSISDHVLINHHQILKRDQEGKEKAPGIIKEEIDPSAKTAADETTFANLLALGQLENVASGEPLGHKFGLPTLPLPSNANLHYRYDPVVDQVTNLLMQHGKLGVAQRVGLISAFSLSASKLSNYEFTRRCKPHLLSNVQLLTWEF